jgi:phosphohistidine phosphatase
LRREQHIGKRHAGGHGGEDGKNDRGTLAEGETKRGAKEAPRVGAYIAENDLKPDMVLCSDAVRTRATLALIMAEWDGPPPKTSFEEGLYLAPPTELLERVHEIGAGVHNLLLIGHNPGVHALALELTGSGDRKLIAGLAKGFTTATLAVLTFDVDTWTDVAPGTGRLRHFVSPRARD